MDTMLILGDGPLGRAVATAAQVGDGTPAAAVARSGSSAGRAATGTTRPTWPGRGWSSRRRARTPSSRTSPWRWRPAAVGS